MCDCQGEDGRWEVEEGIGGINGDGQGWTWGVEYTIEYIGSML